MEYPESDTELWETNKLPAMRVDIIGNRHFWCRGYYVDAVGKNAKKIQEYIQNQLKEDLEYDQMTLKEYIGPFTGESVKGNK